MNTGDLVMFRGRGFFAWLIRTWTRSSWDHCGVIWVVEGLTMVIEARFFGGVSCHYLQNRLKDQPDIYYTNRTISVPLALRHLGDNYSMKDAIRAAFGDHGHSAGWECAEFAAMLLGLDHDERGWTPQNLIETLFPL